MAANVALNTPAGRVVTDGDTIRLRGQVLYIYREAPVGTLAMWLTATPPTGWLILDGSAVSRTTYALLFALWGTTFGVGDGSTTFNLPDLRQRFPLGKAASGTGATLGGTGGTIDHVHAVDVPSTTSGVEGEAGAEVVEASPTITPNVARYHHTHATNPASFNSGTANPPYMAVHFIVRAL